MLRVNPVAVDLAYTACVDSRKAAEEAMEAFKKFRDRPWSVLLRRPDLLDALESAIERAFTSAQRSEEALQSAPAPELPGQDQDELLGRPQILGRTLAPAEINPESAKLACEFPGLYSAEGNPCGFMPAWTVIAEAYSGSNESSDESLDGWGSGCDFSEGPMSPMSTELPPTEKHRLRRGSHPALDRRRPGRFKSTRFGSTSSNGSPLPNIRASWCSSIASPPWTRWDFTAQQRRVQRRLRL